MLAATADKSLSSLPPELTPDHAGAAPVPQSPPAQDAEKSNQEHVKANRWSTARRVVHTGAFHSDAPLELRFSVMNKASGFIPVSCHVSFR